MVALYELLDEFQVLYKAQPLLSTLENVYKDLVSIEVLKNSIRQLWIA